MFGDHSAEKKDYVPGELVRGSLRGGNYKSSKDVTRNQKYLGMLTIVLLFAVVYALFKYFPSLLESFEQERERQEAEQVDAAVEYTNDDAYEIVDLD